MGGTSGNMITTTTWVPRGFAAQHPQRVQLDEKEFDRIAELAKLQLEDAEEDLEEAREEEANKENEPKTKDSNGDVDMDEEAPTEDKGKEHDDDLKEYDLENYDTPDEDEEGEGETMGMFGNIKSLAYHQPGEEDPYITLKENPEEDEEEREELQIMPTDNLLLVGKIEDEVAHLEVYVYEDSADNLYVHHDIMLPAIPLCLEWLDIPVGSAAATPDARGNFVAIGTTSPEIEIWDLDVVDSMFPNAILGEAPDSAKRKKKKKKPTSNPLYHVGAVQALAGNRQHRNLLASGSADKTVKLWDLATKECKASYDYHTDQVCALAWNPSNATTLLSGSYDRTVVWADMRAPSGSKHPRWGVESDVEDIRWDPHDDNYFYVSTEPGMLHFHDSRNAPASPAASKPVWTLQAHDKALSTFDVNPVVPGFVATGSVDKTVKLWNTSGGSGPSLITQREMSVGKVFSARFAGEREVGFRLAVAGSKGVVTVWDTASNRGVRAAFPNGVMPLPEGTDKRGDRIVTVQDDEDSSSDEEEEEEVGSVTGGAGRRGPDGWESMEEDDLSDPDA